MLEKFTLSTGAHGAVWFYRAQQTTVRPMHQHRELELNLVIAGRASYILGDRRYELLASDLLWLFPAQQHQLIDRSPDYEMWVVIFTPQALRTIARSQSSAVLAEKNPAGRFCKTLSEDDAASLGQLCKELYGINGKPEVLNAGLCYLALRSWERFTANNDTPNYHTLHPAVEHVLRMLRRGESDESLAQLSNHAGLSPARLSSRLKGSSSGSSCKV